MQLVSAFQQLLKLSYFDHQRFFRLIILGSLTLILVVFAGAKSIYSQPSQVASTQYWKYASFPVEQFLSYTSPFGYRDSPTGGTREFHRGLDIAGPEGSYIRNWWSGEIVSLSDHTACGTMITIQSGPWQHMYCHLGGYVENNTLIDRDGGVVLQLHQQIPTGARIGRIGMTGRTTGPHLHWGLKYNNDYVDPALVLREMHKQQASS